MLKIYLMNKWLYKTKITKKICQYILVDNLKTISFLLPRFFLQNKFSLFKQTGNSSYFLFLVLFLFSFRICYPVNYLTIVNSRNQGSWFHYFAHLFRYIGKHSQISFTPQIIKIQCSIMHVFFFNIFGV